LKGISFLFNTIYLHDLGLDLIIGNNFLKLYEPLTQRRDIISFHWKDLGNPKNSKIVTTKIVTRNEILNLIKGNLKELRIIWEERNFHISIEETLDEVCLDNPLDSLKNTNHELIVIKLKNPDGEINVPNRIPYSIRDVEEFQQECKDLLDKDLIRSSSSPHSALTFYVENHNKIKRGKRRMMINYKKLNLATVGDSYKLPRKDFILEKIKGCNWFSYKLPTQTS